MKEGENKMDKQKAAQAIDDVEALMLDMTNDPDATPEVVLQWLKNLMIDIEEFLSGKNV